MCTNAAGDPRCPGLKAIATVKTEVELGGKTSIERRFHLSSIALNLLRAANDTHSLKVRRKSAGWDTDYLQAILRRTA